MRILLAPDKFSGTATAGEVIEAFKSTLGASGHSVDSCLLSDGGEGFIDSFGGPNRVDRVTGPLGDDVDAGWRLSGRTAVIEMASASGLALVGGADNNDALAASSYGTGELIGRALDAGATRVLVGIGGSASTDGGLGALRALEPLHRLRGVILQIGCDVQTLFMDCADVFAPQKGATGAQIRMLRARLERLVQMYQDTYGTDVSRLAGAGAGGGLAGGLAALGGELHSGFDLVAEAVDLDEAIEEADLVITGEGFLDAESFNGKLVGGVVDYCAAFGTPVVAVVGETFDKVGGRVHLVSLVEEFGRERAFEDTLQCLAEAALIALERAEVPG